MLRIEENRTILGCAERGFLIQPGLRHTILTGLTGVHPTYCYRATDPDRPADPDEHTYPDSTPYQYSDPYQNRYAGTHGHSDPGPADRHPSAADGHQYTPPGAADRDVHPSAARTAAPDGQASDRFFGPDWRPDQSSRV